MSWSAELRVWEERARKCVLKSPGWGDFESLCQRNSCGGPGEALQAAGQGGCEVWMGSWSRTELGNVLPSDRELCLVTCCPHSRWEGRSRTPERMSRGCPGLGTGRVSSLPCKCSPVDISISGCHNYGRL